MYSFSEKSLERLSTCDEKLQKVALLAIMLSEVDFGISEGYRSPARQKMLYAKGRTAEGDIVTYIDGVKKKGKHNYKPSKAFDVYAYVNGRVSWEKKYYDQINEAIQEAADTFGIIVYWGGEWITFKDYPHFEID